MSEKAVKVKKMVAVLIAIILFGLGLFFSTDGSYGARSGLLLTFFSGYILAARHKFGGENKNEKTKRGHK